MKQAARFDIVIVGGGAAGLFAADRLLSEKADLNLLIIERMSALGKKIRATGNGRCNLAPAAFTLASLHSHAPGRVANIMADYSPEQTLDDFEAKGLPLRRVGDGWYPASLRAESVLLVLQKRLDRAKALVRTDCRLIDFRKIDSQIEITLLATNTSDPQTERIQTRSLLLAGGGKAQPALGSDGSLIQLLGDKNLSFTPMCAALDSFQLEDYPKRLQGTRIRAGLAVAEPSRGRILGVEAGEVLFNKSGLSGIPVMQLSAACAGALQCYPDAQLDVVEFRGLLSDTATETLAGQAGEDWRFAWSARIPEAYAFGKKIFSAAQSPLWAFLDLLPQLSSGETDAWWHKQLTAFAGDAEAALQAFLPKELALYVANVRARLGEHKLPSLLRALPWPVAALSGWDQAQVMAGGLDFANFADQTLELKAFPGVFAAGELLDVHGDCGGYNLQWAWSSAAKAADDILAYLERDGGSS